MTSQPDHSDTSGEALEVQLDCLRQMTPQQRIQQMCAWSGKIRRMTFAAIRRRHPDYSEGDVRLKFIELTYGEHLAEDVRKYLQERKP
jgi:hypothetical protein